MVSHFLTVFILVQTFSDVTTQECRDSYSIYGMMLKGHIIKSMKTSISLECLRACNDDVRCQSFNYVMVENICELNNATKEGKPSYFVPNPKRYYVMVKDVDECAQETHECPADISTCSNTYGSYSCVCSHPYKGDGKNGCIPKAPLGLTTDMPARSCLEVSTSSNGVAVSGSYWLNTMKIPEPLKVYCDIKPNIQPWTLIARFTDTDKRHWMNASGYWWYDKTEAAGVTTDPSTKTDMISLAFWLVSSNEFKITRSDDSQHTALLQTTGDCLGGQTFRSKITGYGDFRNGKKWNLNRCMGNCIVQFDGNYNETGGFQKVGCSGTMQRNNRIGFWCHWGWSSSVMMIGSGGSGGCGGAGHGIGLSAAKSPYLLSESGRPKKDFNSYEWAPPITDYALNLWIRN